MYTRLQSVGVGFLGLLLATMPIPAKAEPACWDLTYAAIRHQAAAPHPRFIQYDATGTIVQDGNVLTRVAAAVAYRDDGTALVADDRFADPYVTTTVDPGPPELGPYAGRRSGWLLPDEMDPSLRVIAKVGAAHRLQCTDRGTELFHGREVYDLVFGSPSLHRAGLQELLIDSKSMEIWKVALRAYQDPLDAGSTTATWPVNYQIELEQSGPYVVVHHITWTYEYMDASQQSSVFGEYYYDDFRFPSQLPSAYFTNRPLEFRADAHRRSRPVG